MSEDLISRFRDYQIEWLTAHNDIEFCEEEEKLIIGFLKDTTESFMRENQSAQQWIPCSERLPDKNGKYLVVGRQKAINILKFDGGRWYGKWGLSHGCHYLSHIRRCLTNAKTDTRTARGHDVSAPVWMRKALNR